MHNKKIMIITYDMYPYAKKWGDFHRMYLLANFLIATGADVILIHKQNDKKSSYSDLPVYFKSIGVKNKHNFFTRIILGNVNSKENNISRYYSYTLILIRKLILPLLKIFDKFVFNDPNSFYGINGYLWTKFSKKQIVNIINKNLIDEVIISAPPFSIFRLVSTIKKKTSAKVILDYRDPWNLEPRRKLALIREEKIINRADKIIVFSEKFKTDLIAKFELPKEKVDFAYNGYSKESWSKVENIPNYTNDKIVISYAGGYSLSKDHYVSLVNFLNALCICEFKSNFVLRLIGNYDSVEARIWKEKLKESIEFIPMVSHTRSLEYMIESDILLLTYTNEVERSKYMLTTKFFDYIKAGKVIWGIGDKSSNFIELIQKHKLGISCKNEIHQIVEELNDIYERKQSNRIAELRLDIDFELDNYSREYGMLKYLNI